MDIFRGGKTFINHHCWQDLQFCPKTATTKKGQNTFQLELLTRDLGLGGTSPLNKYFNISSSEFLLYNISRSYLQCLLWAEFPSTSFFVWSMIRHITLSMILIPETEEQHKTRRNDHFLQFYIFLKYSGIKIKLKGDLKKKVNNGCCGRLGTNTHLNVGKSRHSFQEY